MDDGTDGRTDGWTNHVGTWHCTTNLCNDDITNAFTSSTCINISHAGKNDAHMWMLISLSIRVPQIQRNWINPQTQNANPTIIHTIFSFPKVLKLRVHKMKIHKFIITPQEAFARSW
jgi:hypothetical protein